MKRFNLGALEDHGPVTTTPDQETAARNYVARIALNQDDETLLLDALGLAS